MSRKLVTKDFEIYDAETGTTIAVTYDSEYAPLLASAPELLEILTEIVNSPDYKGIRTHEMRSAEDIVYRLSGLGGSQCSCRGEGCDLCDVD